MPSRLAALHCKGAMLGQRPDVASRLGIRPARPCIFGAGSRPQKARHTLARADTSPQTRFSIASERENAAKEEEAEAQTSSPKTDFAQDQGGVLAANPVSLYPQRSENTVRLRAHRAVALKLALGAPACRQPFSERRAAVPYVHAPRVTSSPCLKPIKSYSPAAPRHSASNLFQQMSFTELLLPCTAC